MPCTVYILLHCISSSFPDISIIGRGPQNVRGRKQQRGRRGADDVLSNWQETADMYLALLRTMKSYLHLDDSLILPLSPTLEFHLDAPDSTSNSTSSYAVDHGTRPANVSGSGCYS